MTFSYLLLSLFLGMRHGLDPDHLAIINGINLNDHSKGKSTIWSGFYFSLGHGVAVTFVGLLIIALSGNFNTYSSIAAFTEWIPILMLIFTGIYGLFALYRERSFGNRNHINIKLVDEIYQGKFVAFRLFITGILFALVFDTTTQVAAWGLVGEGLSKDSQYWIAFLIGLFFTLGMLITDTSNGLFFYKLLHTSDSKFQLKVYLSFLVVVTSLVLGAIQLFEKLGLSIEIPDSFKLGWGILMMILSLIGLFINYLKSKK